MQILLPTDIVVDTAFPSGDREPQPRVVPASEIPADGLGLDIGPDSAAAFAAALGDAQTVFWNGPMGVFEVAAFAEGTRAVAQALTKIPGLSAVGGGDSAAAVRQLGFDEAAFGHISTGAVPASSTSRVPANHRHRRPSPTSMNRRWPRTARR